MAIEISSRSVVVLGGSWVGTPSEDLCVAKWYADIEGIGDDCVTQGVWADVAESRGA